MIGVFESNTGMQKKFVKFLFRHAIFAWDSALFRSTVIGKPEPQEAE